MRASLYLAFRLGSPGDAELTDEAGYHSEEPSLVVEAFVDEQLEALNTKRRPLRPELDDDVLDSTFGEHDAESHSIAAVGCTRR